MLDLQCAAPGNMSIIRVWMTGKIWAGQAAQACLQLHVEPPAPVLITIIASQIRWAYLMSIGQVRQLRSLYGSHRRMHQASADLILQEHLCRLLRDVLSHQASSAEAVAHAC